MKRSVILEDTEGNVIRELVLSTTTPIKTFNEMLYLDKLGDGTWRLIYSESLVPDITKLKCLRIVREGNMVENEKGQMVPELIEESEV
jgi:hypothetical protein